MSVATEKMSFEQLRKKVAELEDTIAYMKRTYEDLFYNLDEDNLGVSLTRKGENMQTSIEQTEEEILLQAEKITAAEQKVAELKITADEITSTVEVVEESLSEISQKANEITSRVVDLETLKESVFVQTANGFLLDGEKTGFTGYIYLTDSDGNVRFTIFHDESQGGEQVMMHSVSGTLPLVLGNGQDVYIGNRGTQNLVATQGWVQDNAPTAVFA